MGNNTLIQSYIKERFFVSTIYRESSACIASPPWYFETLVWAWDKEKRTRGEWLEQHDSGGLEHTALNEHYEICKRLSESVDKLERL